MRGALLAVFLIAATPAFAQTADRLPWFAVDLHAATVGIPQAEGWVPVVSADTKLPGRNWGTAMGVTVYPVKLGILTIGVGGSIISGKGTGDASYTTGSGSTAKTVMTQVVHTGMTSLAPQLSMNFGHKLGWSYLSLGIGRSKVTSRSDALGPKAGVVVPEAWNSALNFGGGAKWFMKKHLGAGFDARFVKLASRSPTAVLPSAKRTQLWNISAGISIQ
jgi:hypothetical protein